MDKQEQTERADHVWNWGTIETDPHSIIAMLCQEALCRVELECETDEEVALRQGLREQLDDDGRDQLFELEHIHQQRTNKVEAFLTRFLPELLKQPVAFPNWDECVTAAMAAMDGQATD